MSGVKKNSYVAYADILRIFAAFAVVLLHVSGARLIQTPVGSREFLWALFYDCLTRWSVPLFIMLSGMLFLKKDKKLDIKALYTKNVLRLVTAFVFWSFVYNFYTAYAQVRDVGEALKTGFFKIPDGAMHTWFIFVIIGLYVVLPFVKRMTQCMTKGEMRYFIVLNFLLTFAVKSLSSFEVFSQYLEYVEKFEINTAVGYVGLFVAGHYIDAYESGRTERIFSYLMGVLGFCYMFFTTLHFSEARGLLAEEFMSFKSVGAFMMAFGTMVFVKRIFGKKEFSRKAKRKLKNFSKCTFGVYLVHELYLNISTAKGWFVLWEYPSVGIVIEAFIVFTVSAVTAKIISSLPLGKYIS